MNSTQTITIEVDAQVAEAYNAASPEERRKLDALLNLTLRRAFLETRSLEEVMEDLSHMAQARGLTPEILGDILDGEDDLARLIVDLSAGPPSDDVTAAEIQAEIDAVRRQVRNQ